MAKITMPYGKDSFVLDMEDGDILAVVRATMPQQPKMDQAEVVREAIAHPINSKPLDQLLRAGEKICLVVPDVTRLWESPFVSVPILLDSLNQCGIKDEDITILCACGTHRRQTTEEHRELLGEEALKRVKVVDHQCDEGKELKYMGETRRGTPVYFNRHATDADKVITLCGVVYHFLAGFGGGGKMLLPGIAGCETIQHNHELALNSGMGKGANPEVCAGNMADSNPFHADIVEAAEMLPPVFALNVVVDDKFRIIKAFAGDWKTSHLEACRLVAAMDGVKIPAKADLVIASAGGYPKDINLYQGIKLLSNSLAAAKEEGIIILVAKFAEGFGNADTQKQICDFEDMDSREKALRDSFSIGAYAGFLFAEAASNYNLILVTDMKPENFAKTKARAVATLEEALALAGKDLPPHTKAIIMPHGATTLPISEK